MKNYLIFIWITIPFSLIAQVENSSDKLILNKKNTISIISSVNNFHSTKHIVIPIGLAYERAINETFSAKIAYQKLGNIFVEWGGNLQVKYFPFQQHRLTYFTGISYRFGNSINFFRQENKLFDYNLILWNNGLNYNFNNQFGLSLEYEIHKNFRNQNVSNPNDFSFDFLDILSLSFNYKF